MRYAKTFAVVLLATACTGRDSDRGGGASDPPSPPDPWAATEVAASAGAMLDEGRFESDKAEAGEEQKERASTRRDRRGEGRGVGRAMGGKASATSAPASPALAEAKPTDGDDENGGGGPGGNESATRSWFPETFLFQPLVVTDAAGAATVAVKVPDRLTTWRVLALAHARTGAQGGATASFLGTLDTYVDLVVPPFLIVGDELKLPIQAVNTTASPVATTLAVKATNAALAGTGGARTLPAQGSVVEYATLKATRAGQIQVSAGLRDTDAVLRTIEVLPSGRPITQSRSGTLAAPRTLTIEGPAGADPTTDRVRLLVYPGALALLRSELGVSIARGGTAEDAYALLLAGKASALLAALGDTPEPAALRELAIVTAQRAIRHGRTLDVMRAALLAEGALAHADNPVMVRLGERAVAYLAQHQRPDGTFAGGAGWTLQRVLAATADATSAVTASTPELRSSAAGGSATRGIDRGRTQAVLARARGAFERHHTQIDDAYTAAAMLATGAVTGDLVAVLRARVRGAIRDASDGAKYLEVPAGVVRGDGRIPGRAEATALAVLALAGDPDAPVADLGATLLGSYTPIAGWGDGRANLACMRAVLELFKTPVPAGVTITLAMDGKEVARGALDRERLREVLALETSAPGLAGAHTWTITAEPAVPGLGFALALHSWVPWDKQPVTGGLELALPATVTGVVGRPIDVAITAVAPSGIELRIEQALPAGVQVDTPSLQALVDAGTIHRFTAADGKLELEVPALEPGQTFTAKYRAIPTLAGKLRSAASTIEAGVHAFHVPPTEWTIK